MASRAQDASCAIALSPLRCAPSTQDVHLLVDVCDVVDTLRAAAAVVLAAHADVARSGGSSSESSGAATADDAALLEQLCRASEALDAAYENQAHPDTLPAACQVGAALLDW